MNPPIRAAILLLLLVPAVFAQIDGKTAYAAFTAWKNAPEHRGLKWDEAIAKYSLRLIAGGLQAKFPAHPNKLLIEAVSDRKPGRALDVAMGQRRHALHLAHLGWDVKGFHTSRAGLDLAQVSAKSAGLSIRTILYGGPVVVECSLQGSNKRPLRIRHQ